MKTAGLFTTATVRAAFGLPALKGKVTQAVCVGKSGPEKNEDGWYASKHFVAVFDGSTAAGPINGVPGGVVATQALVKAMQRVPAKANAQQCIAILNRAVQQASQSALVPPFSAVTILSLHKGEIWRVGDTPFALDGEWNILPNFPHEDYMYAKRQYAIRSMREEPTPENIRKVSAQATLDVVDGVKNWVNNPTHRFNHGMVNGNPISPQFLEVYKVPSNTKQIMLGSDGALVSPHGQRGPINIPDMWNQIESLRTQDPECVNLFEYWRGFNPGTTLLDDTTLVVVNMGR